MAFKSLFAHVLLILFSTVAGSFQKDLNLDELLNTLSGGDYNSCKHKSAGPDLDDSKTLVANGCGPQGTSPVHAVGVLLNMYV